MTPPMQITADEINCLIYSYLQDSGFQHTAFSLRIEGHLDASPYSSISIRRGELVELLAKSLLYTEVESHWKADEVSSTCKASFSLLQDHVCSAEETTDNPVSLVPVASLDQQRPPLQNGTHQMTNGIVDQLQKRKAEDSRFQDLEKRTPVASGSMQSAVIVDHSPQDNGRSAIDLAQVHMDIDVTRINQEEPPQQNETNENHDDALGPPPAVTLLRGHNTEVFVCSWNPKDRSVLATGAKDGTLRLWRFKPWSHDVFSIADSSRELTQVEILAEPSIEMSFAVPAVQADVTTIEWSPAGTFLASGSFDGMVRVWTIQGILHMYKQQHEGPIFSVKFSPSGKWLLTAGMDGTVCVWDAFRKSLHRQLRCHQDPCLDVDWLDDSTFASGSADHVIRIFDLANGDDVPLVKFEGHRNEVNQIKCNKPRSLLASCSDDNTARIWPVSQWKRGTFDLGRQQNSNGSFLQVSQGPLHTLEGHTDSIGSIAWRPSDSEGDQILATAAFDATCRLWNALTGECLRVFADNRQPVFTLSFSADGSILASGGGDGWFHLYDAKTWKKIWSWETDRDTPGIFEIEWQESRRISVCLENQCVALVDLARIASLPRR